MILTFAFAIPAITRLAFDLRIYSWEPSPIIIETRKPRAEPSILLSDLENHIIKHD